jgi:hypothetical protein
MGNGEKYIQYAEALSDLTSLESDIHNKKRLTEDLRIELKSDEYDGSFGLEFTDHAFKQILERLEELAVSNSIIYKDVFKPDDTSKSLLIPSNTKSFIIALLADGHSKKMFKERDSKSNKSQEGSKEYRYEIEMKKWSKEKSLQFVAIVENNFIKTGFFNWV